MIKVEQDYSDSELVQAANYFNDAYARRSMSEVRLDLLDKMKMDSSSMHQAMQTAVEMAQGLLEDKDGQHSEVLVSGEDQLINLPDFEQTDQLKGNYIHKSVGPVLLPALLKFKFLI